MEIFILWLLASIAVGVIAGSRGRMGIVWFSLACVISPILAGILVLVIPRYEVSDGQQIIDGTAKKCSMCAELVKREAIKCKHCGADLAAVAAPSADELSMQKYGG